MEASLRKQAINSIIAAVKKDLGVTMNIDDDGQDLETLFIIHFIRTLVNKYAPGMKKILDAGGDGVRKFLDYTKTSSPDVITGALLVETTPISNGMTGPRAIDEYKKCIKQPLPFANDLTAIIKVYNVCNELLRTYNSLIYMSPIILNNDKK